MQDELIKIFERDLEKLKSELHLFETDGQVWVVSGNIKNSAGNLCLHICGNLKHFIGHVLGGTNFIREREKEFSLKNVPLEELIKNTDETIIIVTSVLKEIDSTKLKNIYPINVFKKEMTTEFFLIHLATHLNYHLGQINYLRRLMIN